MREPAPLLGLVLRPDAVEAKVILQAMKTYGLILADNGSDWYVSGDSDDGWDPLMEGIINAMSAVHGSDFEVVDSGPTITTPG